MRKQKKKKENILPGLLALGTGVVWMVQWLKKMSLKKEQRLQREQALFKEQVIQRERRLQNEQGIPEDSAAARARVAQAGAQVPITRLEAAEDNAKTPE